MFLLIPFSSMAADVGVEEETYMDDDFCERLAEQIEDTAEDLEAARIGCFIEKRPLACGNYILLYRELNRLLRLWKRNCQEEWGDPPASLVIPTELETVTLDVAQSNTATSTSTCPCGQ